MINNTRIAVVTGAMGGIGLDICYTLKSEGYIVVGLYNKHKNDDWSSLSCFNKLIQCDINNTNSCDVAVTEIIEEYGGIDILVNVAGITRDSTFKKMSFTDWSQVIQTNLIALYNITHPIFNHMMSNQYGRIVNISSVNGHKGQFGQVNYAAAKAGIYGLLMV